MFIVRRMNGHKRLHQFLSFDEKSKCFFDPGGVLLDTKEKHEEFLQNYDVKYLSIELI